MFQSSKQAAPSPADRRPISFRKAPALWAVWAVLAVVHAPLGAVEATSGSTIRVAGVMDLEGTSKHIGQQMRTGIAAALRGEKIQGRDLEFVAVNDFYDPVRTAQKTRELVEQGVFAMLGNVGTATAEAALPILAESEVPAIGFFTGASLLRPGAGDIINYRASYAQEIATTVEQAMAAGVAPTEICAYLQNDAYGMAGIEGIKQALAGHPDTEETLPLLDEIVGAGGPEPSRNHIGPVGVYTPNTATARDGYSSLKNWETRTNVRCRLVVTVGTYEAIGKFVAYSRYKGEDWVVSAISFTEADSLRRILARYGVSNGVLVSAVVPNLDSSLAIVDKARNALGEELSFVSLEGYIVGKMLLHGMRQVDGDLTREAFLNAIVGKRLDLGGLDLDFTTDNQGSDLVHLIELKEGAYRPVTTQEWARIFSG